MKVTILGCGGSAGVPMVGGADGRGIWGRCDPTEPRNKRSRASIFLEMKNGENILVDTGPDVREQLLVNRLTSFKSIFYTHAHADHIAGLDEVRAVNRIINAPITAYGRAEVLEEIEARFGYIFQPWAGTSFYRAVVKPSPITPYHAFEMGGHSFLPFQQKHGRGETTGLRFGSFAYSTDVVELDSYALAALKGVETWVVDCFQLEPHCAHAWLERVLEWKNILHPKRIILTHLGPDMDWRWMVETLPAGVEPAWDGLSFEVPEPAYSSGVGAASYA